KRLAGAAAVAQAGELEELVQFDDVAFVLEVELLHGGGGGGCVSVAASARGCKRAGRRVAAWPAIAPGGTPSGRHHGLSGPGIPRSANTVHRADARREGHPCGPCHGLT